jgi:phospholipase C
MEATVAAWLAATVVFAAVAAASTASRQSSTHRARRDATVRTMSASIHRIKHVVVIMQENRSFDSYFGTYPGADGFPTHKGHFSVCEPNPATHGCDYPYHDPALVNVGAKHNRPGARADVAGGQMSGFIRWAQLTTGHRQTDVMGYHDAREIPNYWAYARDFVLQDHMFEPSASWSLPAHLFTVSEWSAGCRTADPMSRNAVHRSRRPHLRTPQPIQRGRQPSHQVARSARPVESGDAVRDRLRVDRHDVPPVPTPRQLALLRRARFAARLRG